MKPPSKNMSASLRGQSPGGRGPEPVTVTSQNPQDASGMVIPGEGGVENPPGTVDGRSAKNYARAVGGHFGGGN